jgi:multiple sugar transport system ATP-binding protein
MAKLEVNNLSKRFGDRVIVDEMSFHVDDGEFFVLLGPSGGGKSTLLRLICGLEQPDSGQIVIGGRDVTRVPPRERNVGMVFQDYGLYPNMNVYQNIAYGLEARGMARAEVERRVTSAAQKLGLADMLKRSIVDLSGGEQQRVALARALAKDADVYLFDEPLSNLDPKLRTQARRDIQAVHREKGKPSLYVTHDQTEAFALGDRIAIIHAGRLQQVAQPDGLLASPANVFVATFIGSPPMNVFRAALARNGDGYCARCSGLQVRLPERWRPVLDRYDRDEIILGLRPNALAVDGPTVGFEVQPENTFTARVHDVEPLMGEMIVTLSVDGPDAPAHTLSAVFPDTGEVIEPDQRLRVAIDVAGVCLFDPQTEQALQPA